MLPHLHKTMSSDPNSPTTAQATPATTAAPLNFIEQYITDDLATGRVPSNTVVTRFPPEPNGYLHIGHAKSICLNFGLARKFGGRCHLRMDDTNPTKEDTEYVESIQEDVRWLGGEWGAHFYFASDYFDKLYHFAEILIQEGKAFVCDLTPDQMRTYRGSLTEAGKPSPFRDRTPTENLDLFRRMRSGEFADGSRTLRAKIDMASPNVNLRDPVLYRILRAHHHRTGDKWCIYPMYDYAHPLSDALEGITHSICTLEFEIHRPLYDWCVESLRAHLPSRPRQYEFARLNLTHTVMSKRKLLHLVKDRHVRGWDDPRLPTISGLRRRGYTPEAIREFCERVGVAKRENTIELALLEYCLRQDLEVRAPRALAVLRPIKVVIENYPEGQTEWFECAYSATDPSHGSRKMPFSREIYIEQDDFRETPPPKYFRLFPGNEVRLRWAYFVTCTNVIKDPTTGQITEIRATYDPASRGGTSPDGRKVKGTIHWVDAALSIKAETRLYENLFLSTDPEEAPEGKTFLDNLNTHSLETLTARVEPALASAPIGTRYQFERLGYFTVDPDTKPGAPVFNRTVSLKDSFSKK